MIISIIVAVAENWAIGKQNQLLWHLPADLKWFKTHTTGHAIVMGRKTFESIGKPLPNRKNVILTANKNFVEEGCEVVHSTDELLLLLKKEEEIFIIGGGDVYRSMLPKATKLYLTRVHHSFEGDVFFPSDFNQSNDWHLTSEEYHRSDEKNNYAYTFQILERISSVTS